jgi:hypothetical protein
MQRIPLFSIALLSTVAVSNAALAGPLFLDPQSQRTPIASIFGAPPPAEPVAPPVRQVAAQGEYGGGFLEMLFRGPGGAREPITGRIPPTSVREWSNPRTSPARRWSTPAS